VRPTSTARHGDACRPRAHRPGAERETPQLLGQALRDGVRLCPRGVGSAHIIRPDHPLQRRILDLIADVTVVSRRDIAIAIDGCGVPTFGVPLRSFAYAFARLAEPQRLPSQHGSAGQRVRDAMIANPGTVAGTGRLDTRVMETAAGCVLAKGGAEACHGAALLDRGWGIAIKIEDGGVRAVAVALRETLRQLDALGDAKLAQLEGFARPLVRNYREEVVGEGRPVFQLHRGT
jgi:L-asparaginase II